MVNQKLFEEMNARMSELIAQSPAKDLQKNLQAMLASAFSRMNLVTREEFDVQQEVLIRTREKLAQLEARVAEMEKAAAPGQEG